MYTAVLDKSVGSIDQVRRHIRFSEKVRAQIGVPSFGCKAEGAKCFDIEAIFGNAADATAWRKIDHCSAITRAYALFEGFIAELLREYLVFLASSYKFTQLEEGLRGRYITGVGEIISDPGRPQNRGIDVQKLMEATLKALADDPGYALQPEALLRKDANLRLQQVQQLFSGVGLGEMKSFLDNHRSLRTFFGSGNRLTNSVESELQQIVEYRNEASHGDVDTLLGTDILVEFTEFFEALFHALTDFVRFDSFRRAKELGKLKIIGTITHQYGGTVICALVKDVTLTVGTAICILKSHEVLMGEVKSLQIDKQPHVELVVGDETEIALDIGVTAKPGNELVLL